MATNRDAPTTEPDHDEEPAEAEDALDTDEPDTDAPDEEAAEAEDALDTDEPDALDSEEPHTDDAEDDADALDLDDVGPLDRDEVDAPGTDADDALDLDALEVDDDLEDTERLDEVEPIPLPPVAEPVEPEGPLLADADTFRERWDEVQSGFVDDPRRAVDDAGQLLADVLDTMARTLAAKRDDLEAQWGRDDDTSTEELRLAFRAYRSFYDRVVSI
ncbi:MAG: hypothetical protein ACRD2C_04320 [Acidimicrobiales bacterium]